MNNAPSYSRRPFVLFLVLFLVLVALVGFRTYRRRSPQQEEKVLEA